MLLLLNQLLSQSLEEKTIAAYHVLDLLLLFSHHLEAFETLSSYVVAGNLHCDLLIGLIHLRHIHYLTEKIRILREHTRSLATRTMLYLLMIEEVHLVDEARHDIARLLL